MESMGGNDEARSDSTIAHEFVYMAEILGVRELDPNLFEGLSRRGDPCGQVMRLHAPARKGHVSGPGIVLV